MEVDLSKIAHRFRPELLETVRQVLRELLVANEQRREPPFRNERVIERQDHRVVVDDMKRMTELPGVPDPRHVFEIDTVRAEKREELWRRLISEAEYHTARGLVSGALLAAPRPTPAAPRSTTARTTSDGVR